jgi:RluA family pseudouridine synthase
MDTMDKRIYFYPGKTRIEIYTLYLDDSYLAVNKPAGLPSLPDGYDSSAPHLKGLLEPLYGRLWIVHRLDRDTSGVLLLARSAVAHRELNRRFEQRQVVKRYHAVICGCPDWEQKEVRLPLRPDGDRRHRTIVDEQRGKPSTTEFHLLARLGRYALVEASPHTGRTHQIRAHLSAIGLPILGDTLYGGQAGLYTSMLKPGFTCGSQKECALIERSALHAFSLDLAHPERVENLHLEAPYPKDFKATLRMLQRYPT